MKDGVFIVRGSRKPLSGTLTVRGAKNDSLKAFASSLLFQNPIIIQNVPLIEDIFRMTELLRGIGVLVQAKKPHTFVVDSKAIKGHTLIESVAKRMRASILLAGPLVARTKEAIFPHPGGCVIGKRSIDAFLDGWKKMGITIEERGDSYRLFAKRIHGCRHTFRNITVGGTEALMMTAVLAHGTTILSNAAMEPEISHLASFLNSCGAKIKGAGTHTITIEGTGGRLLRGGTFVTLPDRIETGSFLILGALLGRNLKIKNCTPEHSAVVTETLRGMGVKITEGKNWLSVSRPKVLKATDIKTKEYPGFPTDIQAPFVILATQALGTSLIFETVFNGRLNYIEDLNRMGAHIVACDPHRVLVSGPTPLEARSMESPDLRAGLAFIIAAAVAKGTSTLGNIYQIDRGYERIDRRLAKIGIDIKRKLRGA